MTLASVFAGAKRDLLMSGWLPMTMVTAIVSPKSASEAEHDRADNADA